MSDRSAALARHASSVGDVDSVISFDGASWADYERVLAMRGDRSAPRISYVEGLLEIMAPSRHHEDIKSTIACLVEVYCLEHEIRFTALGSWTLKHKGKQRGAEPDECYQLGEGSPNRPPELAIEVEWTSGRIDKLDIYRKLGVREVWYWREGEIQPYRLRGEHYRRVRASTALRGIDLVQLASFIGRATTYDSIQGYRKALRRR
jgi:Uma2 family endonuclease